MFKQILVVSFAALSLVSAHIEMVYPPSRGLNLNDNQWEFPCGGFGYKENNTRTPWPIRGGAVAFQPGHNAGHSTAFLFVNLFIGNNNSGPGNVHNISIKPMFQITAPDNTNEAFNGTVCFPTTSFIIPNNTLLRPGMNGTIQVVELAKNGDALYVCSDITFVNDDEVAPLDSDTCTNGTGIGFKEVFVTQALKSSAVTTSYSTSTAFSVTLLTVLALWFQS